MIELTEDEHDAIIESFNIGIGSAAASLSEMLEQEISLSIPSFEIISKADILNHRIDSLPKHRISGVKEQFSGEFSGNALLLFPEDRSLELVRILLQQDISLEDLTEMEEEALVEVGNIILNACISSIADILGSEIANEIPTPVRGSYHDIICGQPESSSHSEYLLQLQMDFDITEINIQGHIAFMMDLDSLENFRQSITKAFGFSPT